MKNILHITHHDGCRLNLNFISKSLGLNIKTQVANWNYNIGEFRAKEIWEQYKDYYNSFDLIITSDTAPLSRIFLHNNYSGKLIIWIANRFDYVDQTTNDCNFPDKNYYKIFQKAENNPNVKIISYTKFEYEYAAKYRKVKLNSNIIKPCAFDSENTTNSAFPANVVKNEVFFIPPYHNDTLLLNLKEKCEQLGINVFNGRYNGPKDLMGIKGIIHIPYAWSNLALFENWSMGNVYFIPSVNFLLKLADGGDFFWSPPFDVDLITSSEWYLPEHEDLFIFFDNWEHLLKLTKEKELLNSKKERVKLFSENHTKNMINKWEDAVNNW